MDATIVWQGLSQLDNSSPLVAIVTGITGRSKNPKTGPMAQLWILRADISPLAAIKRGSDSAICGDCVWRGDKGKNRGCYVTVPNAPTAIWNKYKRGGYRELRSESVALLLRANGIRLRLGAYGDPGALPVWLLHNLTSVIAGHTGYTHAWRYRPELAPFVVASADTPADVASARALGFRTFRTRTPEQPLLAGEIACPASEEAGKRTTCDRCNLCDGSRENERRKSVAIIAHGTGTSYVLNFIRKAS